MGGIDTYDALARLQAADYYEGDDLSATPTRQYAYNYDPAGNRVQQVVTVSGSPTTTNYTYSAANQLTGDGVKTYTYDANGNLTSDGTNTRTWDRANRLLSYQGSDYAYNGLGQRVSQTVSSVVTEYLLDMQPGLWKVIAADDGTDVNRYIHDPVRGRILQHEDPSSNWNWPALDGLGTVRQVYDDTLTEVYAADRDPYGVLIASTGSNPTPFEYTGEPEDQNGLLHLRARYYDPSLAVFKSRDPLETPNRYAYVGGDPVNASDPSGLLKREQVFYPDGVSVFEGKAEYSCHCGWIDWSHATPPLDLLRNIDKAAELSRDSNYPYFGVRFSLDSWPVHFEDISLFPAEMLRASEPSTRTALALNIFMNNQYRFEEMQGDFFVGTPGLASGILQGIGIEEILGRNTQELNGFEISSFSEEDLLSDLIGFYIAKRMVRDNVDVSVARNEIRRACSVFSKSASQQVWDDTYGGSGGDLYSSQVVSRATTDTGWREWNPRLTPLLDCQGNIDMSHSPSGSCNRQSRSLPPQLADLIRIGNPDQALSRDDFLISYSRHNGMPNVGSRGNGIYYVRDQYEPPFDIFREVQLEPNIYGYEGV